jgi:hypothetical protein
MKKFEIDRNKIPKVVQTESILNSFEDHFVVYRINHKEFVNPTDMDPEHAEKMIYTWIAWYEKIQEKLGPGFKL